MKRTATKGNDPSPDIADARCKKLVWDAQFKYPGRPQFVNDDEEQMNISDGSSSTNQEDELADDQEDHDVADEQNVRVEALNDGLFAEQLGNEEIEDEMEVNLTLDRIPVVSLQNV